MTQGHVYRDTWYGGQRCHCCNLTDEGIAARQARHRASMRANHCEQAQAGYWYCEATPDDPCGPGRYPHRGHAPGQCSVLAA